MGTIAIDEAVLWSQCPFGGVVVTRAPERRDVQYLAGELVHRYVLQIGGVQLVDHSACRAIF
jgi:hypothetical protein